MRFSALILSFLAGVYLACSAANKIIRGPFLKNPSTNSMTVRWQTKDESPSILRLIDEQGKKVLYKNPLVNKDHQVELTDLEAGVNYQYQIFSQKIPSLKQRQKYKKVYPHEQLAKKKNFHFKTQSKESKPLHIWILGDPGTSAEKDFPRKAQKMQFKARDAYYDYKESQKITETDLILSLGDNSYYYGNDKSYQKGIFEVYDDLLPSTPLYTAFGNHDSGINKEQGTFYARSYPYAQGDYYETFGFPPFYSFDYGKVHFVVLDSYDSLWEDLQEDNSNYKVIYKPSSTVKNSMLEWLAKDLEANESQWTIVAFHHPPLGRHGFHRDIWKAWTNANFIPIIEKHGVDLVLTGHIHNYQRTHQIKSVLDKARSKDLDESEEPIILFEREDYWKAVAELNLEQYKSKIIDKDNEYRQGAGTVYAIVGASGAAFKDITEKDKNKIFAYQIKKSGSMILDITGKELAAKYLSSDGEILDKFIIKR